eukprot:CAMPEP_0114407596 /NCGR_PEP_ID=MMETSP0102-20121206/22046_1 /TAXON_ID=38822 ORGANISM="Pteridomonas danica, Strain PT" /NCGR_SAMPLE_ID=MMETSP0102 /ASSEMBLY_ACC=CAM_ASM_000212 /LENGTH=55 /DNA_ID=CAMNT_0001574113 /DNA_START=103 /DNA_END=270 /DNA_ORIENTATION=-
MSSSSIASPSTSFIAQVVQSRAQEGEKKKDDQYAVMFDFHQFAMKELDLHLEVGE